MEAKSAAWGRVLDQIRRALAEALAAVDEQERALAGPAPDPGAGEVRSRSFEAAAGKLEEWNRRADRCGEHARQFEEVLAEQGRVLSDWRERLAGVRKRLAAGPPPLEPKGGSD